MLPCWTDVSGIFDPDILSGMPPGKTALAQQSFLLCPTDPAGARHWFPADGIGCLPFCSVVSSGAQQDWNALQLSLSTNIYIYIYMRGCPQATMDRPQVKAGTAALLVALAAEGRGASRQSVFDGSGSGDSIFMDDDPMPVDAGDSFGSVPGVEHAVVAATLQPARFWPAELDAIDELYHCAERPDGGSFKAIPRADMR